MGQQDLWTFVFVSMQPCLLLGLEGSMDSDSTSWIRCLQGKMSTLIVHCNTFSTSVLHSRMWIRVELTRIGPSKNNLDTIYFRSNKIIDISYFDMIFVNKNSDEILILERFFKSWMFGANPDPKFFETRIRIQSKRPDSTDRSGLSSCSCCMDSLSLFALNTGTGTVCPGSSDPT